MRTYWVALLGVIFSCFAWAGGNITPPVWNQNPIALATAAPGEAYTADLSPFAVSTDGEPLTFSMIAGPSWLAIASHGVLAGTPAIADTGVNQFTVEACNPEGACADTVVAITVAANP